MTITSQAPRVRRKTVCTSPEAAELLPAYIVDQLDDAEAETVQNHLNEGPRCKDHYLTMLEARSEAKSEAKTASNPVETTVLASPVEPVKIPTSAIRRKGKASGSVV